MSESIVEQTYQALLSVVQTTAVTRKVLRRPPFTFLHKLLVETIGATDVFTPTQLDFSALESKEDKAAFLTRALAFVTFAMVNAKEQCVSCLLLVSPIKVLAGVAVDDTLEFLLQLCVVCKSVDRDAKDAAAQQVLQKGDEFLYKSSVSFRRGLILVQAVIRTFIRRRVGKRRALEISARSPTSRIPMTVGTRFLKELPHGRIYDGVIRSIQNNRYTLVYDQDPEAQDAVDEIEMKIILEESQRLAMFRDRISESGRRISKRHSKRSDDADISLTSLPDLSLNQRSPRRVSSGDSGASFLAPKPAHPVLVRALSQRPTKSNLDSLGGEFIRPASQSSSPLLLDSSGTPSTSSTRPLQSQEPRSTAGEPRGTYREATPSGDASLEAAAGQEPSDTSSTTWQASLKKMLDDGRNKGLGAPPVVPTAVIPKPEASGGTVQKSVVRKKEKLEPPPSRLAAALVPNFPKLSIPGTKPLLPSNSKRKISDVVGNTTTDAKSKPPARGRSTDRSNEVEPSVQPSVLSEGSVTNSNNTARHRSNSVISLRGSIGSEAPADAAFTETYQSTDQKTQEKLAFIREVVMHIDSYMRRKRLRVIDLFRFCDADGNGSISPQEMIDTLSQMEIQLTPEQGAEFINYIDKDGNGSIDIDEFEELVRVARRADAQREHLKREPSVSKRGTGEGKAPGKFAAVVKAKQRILDEFKAAQPADGEGVRSSQFRSMLASLALPNVDETCVNALVDRAIAMGTGKASSLSHSNNGGGGVASNAGKKAAVAPATAAITYMQLAKALDDLEWAKKANRFLNQAWITQFDSQMERAAREFDLL